MKNLYILLLALFTLAACNKDKDNAVQVARDPSNLGEIGSTVTIDTLRRSYTAAPVLMKQYYITGVVISDAASGNFPEGYVVIQDGKRGITLALTAEQALRYSIGDSLLINIEGDTLTNQLGTLVLSGVNTDHIQTVGTGIAVAPAIVALKDLSAKFADYEATLVRVVNATLNPTPADTDTYAGDRFLTDVSGNSTVILHTAATATWAAELAPVMGTFIAIPAYYNTDGQHSNVWASKRLLVRSLADVKPVSVIAGWQFGSPTAAGNEITFPANTVSSSLEIPSLQRGSGLNTSALARGFSSNAAYIIKTRDDANTYNSYFEFKLKVATSETMSLNSITARMRRSAAGANTYRWTYSLDEGATFNDVGNTDVSFTSTVDGVDQDPVDLSGIEALQNIPAGTTVTLRLYVWGFSNVGSGTFAIGRYGSGITTNSLAITGLIQ